MSAGKAEADSVRAPELIARTPNLDCPACQEKRRHEPAERPQYHPLAGSSGQNVGSGTEATPGQSSRAEA
jgi:hypothetical protein